MSFLAAVIVNTAYGLLLIAIGICAGLPVGLAYNRYARRIQHEEMLERKAKARAAA